MPGSRHRRRDRSAAPGAFGGQHEARRARQTRHRAGAQSPRRCRLAIGRIRARLGRLIASPREPRASNEVAVSRPRERRHPCQRELSAEDRAGGDVRRRQRRRLRRSPTALSCVFAQCPRHCPRGRHPRRLLLGRASRSRRGSTTSRDGRYVADAARHGLQVLPVLLMAPSSVRRHPRPIPSTASTHPRTPRTSVPSPPFWRSGTGRTATSGSSTPSLPDVPIRVLAGLERAQPPRLLGDGPSPSEYTELLKATADGPAKRRPDADIVTAGLPYSKIRGTLSPEHFLRGMYAAGAKGSFNDPGRPPVLGHRLAHGGRARSGCGAS